MYISAKHWAAGSGSPPSSCSPSLSACARAGVRATGGMTWWGEPMDWKDHCRILGEVFCLLVAVGILVPAAALVVFGFWYVVLKPFGVFAH